MKSFYDPTPEHLDKLSDPWCCSYSGGKDSTSLVTWIEWLRRAGWITVERPQLVQSDTGVEDVKLQAISRQMMDVLRGCGWECAVVEPAVSERLYPQILGRGLPPIHPGVRRMRWCTRSTKIDPMERWRKECSGGLTMTGMRLGESAMRDGKLLKKTGCASGGECGIPDPDERTFSPIINWTTCHVVDWLNGMVGKPVRKMMGDLFAVTKELVGIYGVKVGQPTFDFAEPEITASRFGCQGCPAIGAERFAPQSVVRRNGKGHPFNELYDVWYQARQPESRLLRLAGKAVIGPLKMAVRQILFARVMDIQRRAGVVLVTPEDEAFIRQCWANKVYPRGWSEADELTEAPTLPLYMGVNDA